MFPFFSYIHRPFSIFLLLLLLPRPLPAIDIPAGEFNTLNLNHTWHAFMRFLDAGKGTNPDGLDDLKHYFRRFGYLKNSPGNLNFPNAFDDEFEQALLSYQKNLGLSETGKLDFNTMKVIVSPRCGVEDFTDGGGGSGGGGEHGIKTMRRFTFFDRQPRWSRSLPILLTYAFSPTNVIDYVGMPEIKAAFARAFSRWSEATLVNFTEAKEYSKADIKIGWYSGDHGDGMAFDGKLGMLAHAFAPESGWCHLDAAERWAVDFDEDHSEEAFDLESVATHEIGHLLGLGHSSVNESIMYPTLDRRTKKVELQMDDVEGIQSLYGSNPNFNDHPVHPRLDSSGRGIVSERRKGLMWSVMAMAVVAWLGF